QGKAHVETRLTPEGELLAARIREIWRLVSPLLSLHDGARGFAGRFPVRLALPEMFPDRAFAELLRRLHDQPWGDEVELIMRRRTPRELDSSSKVGSDDLVLAIAGGTEPPPENRDRRLATF